jgi:hypothetical protein
VAKSLFEALELPVSQVPLALTALQKHSQNMLFGDTSKDDQYSKRMDDKGWKETEAMFGRLDMSDMISVDMSLDEFSKLIKI